MCPVTAESRNFKPSSKKKINKKNTSLDAVVEEENNMNAQNQFALANMGAQNQALATNTGTANMQADRSFEVDKMNRDFQLQQQNFEYQKLLNKEDSALARKQAADAARAQAKSDLIGGIAGVASAVVGGLGAAPGQSFMQGAAGGLGLSSN